MDFIAGIDYGAKLAGTTVIAWMEQNKLQFAACPKGRDADAFLLSWIRDHQPRRLFLDAPLSLPGRYQGLPGFEDYFYRFADRELQAMSPMFLGGLSARAMQLADQLRLMGIDVLETYPSHLSRLMNLKALGYKKEKANISEVARVLANALSCPMPVLPDWHHVDASLALLSGIRHQRGEALTFGQLKEGVIVV